MLLILHLYGLYSLQDHVGPPISQSIGRSVSRSVGRSVSQ